MLQFSKKLLITAIKFYNKISKHLFNYLKLHCLNCKHVIGKYFKHYMIYLEITMIKYSVNSH